MKDIDCNHCPIAKYCGTMIGSLKLCKLYYQKEDKNEEDI